MSQTSARYQDETGRQDVAAPAATVEKSDPTPVDQERGQRLWLYIALVAVVFVAVIVAVIVSR